MKIIILTRKKKIFLLILLLGIFSSLFVPIKLPIIARMALYPLEVKYKKDIKFATSAIRLTSKIELGKVSIRDSSGLLFYFRRISVNYNIFHMLSGRHWTDVKVEDVKLYNDVRIFDSVADMMNISGLPDVEFKNINGSFEFYKEATYVEKFSAINDLMRLDGNGWVGRNGDLDCNIKFTFGENVTKDIPDIIKKTLLTNEGGGRMSIELKLSGNYRKPTLHIASSKLKINIIEGMFK